MDAYIYQADFYCEDCGYELIQEIRKENPHIKADDFSSDSDDFPQSVTIGESDVPQHCGHCHCHLENPLTKEGYRYVIDSILEHFSSNGRDGNRDTLQEWISFYDVSLDDLFQEVEGRKGKVIE